MSGVVSNGRGILKKGIIDVALNKKPYYQNVQVQIYRVVVDVLNIFTYNKYNGQNKIKIISLQCKYRYDTSEQNTILNCGLF